MKRQTEYEKPIMSRQELIKMGYQKEFLDKAYRHPGQNFAFKSGNGSRCSIMFKTAEFDNYVNSLCGNGR